MCRWLSRLAAVEKAVVASSPRLRGSARCAGAAPAAVCLLGEVGGVRGVSAARRAPLQVHGGSAAYTM
eukprot:4406081-Prymnesium_polylepis.1